jgi:DNA-binding NtrC family response regulator
MADHADKTPKPKRRRKSPAGGDNLRWQAFFQRAREPLFVLNRRRRLLFVNRAWEELTGLTAADVWMLACGTRGATEPGPWSAIGRALCPPPEALEGRPARARRLIPGADPSRRWWDITFFPLQGEDGLLGVVGKIAVAALEQPASAAPPPEEAVAVRERVAERHRLDQLAAGLPGLRRIAEQVRLAAQTRVPVLISGEAGSGKQWTARVIHYGGATREHAFAALDCAHLPPTALADALFGTGGLARRASPGTLYLREPARLPRDVQAVLAHWMAESGPSGLRLIAGSTVDPTEEVRAGRLLEALYCGLATLQIALPPLRERPGDLPELVDRLLGRVRTVTQRPLAGLTADAWECVRAYRWPGNIAELYAVLREAALRAPGERIDAADLPVYLRQAVKLDQTPGPEPERPIQLKEVLRQVERRLILLALQRARGNRSRAAQMLSVWRPYLLRRMEALGITEAEAGSGSAAPLAGDDPDDAAAGPQE